MSNGWIGVDLDGTLAKYDGWKGEDHIGEPIPRMVDRVCNWLRDGKEVRIVTARACTFGRPADRVLRNIIMIQRWCREHIGVTLAVTAEKDYSMLELWDDRCHRVEANTGRLIGEEDE